MSKSELTKKNLYYGDSDTLSFIQELSGKALLESTESWFSLETVNDKPNFMFPFPPDKGSSPAASEPDVSMSFHPHVRQVKSDSVTHWITANSELVKSQYGGGSSASKSET